MVGRFHERMDLPDFVQRQPQAESRHLRALAALNHGFQKALVTELCGEEFGPRAPELIRRFSQFVNDIRLGVLLSINQREFLKNLSPAAVPPVAIETGLLS
jgi:hypothetical protein